MTARLILAAFALLLCAASPEQQALLLSARQPSLSCDFVAPVTMSSASIAASPRCPPIVFARASGATYSDAASVMQTAATDVARIDYGLTHVSRGLLIEEQRTNSLRNSQAGGASAGAPGTLPTNWGTVPNVNTYSVIGTGTESGYVYVDLRLQGSSSAVSGWLFETATQVAALQNQVWSAGGTVQLIAGSVSNVGVSLSILPTNAAGTGLTAQNTTIVPTATAQVFASTYTLPDATTAFVYLRIRVAPPASAFDFTLRVSAPQLELGAFATSYIPTAGAAATRAADSASIADNGWLRSGAGRAQIEGTTLAGVPFITSQIGDAAHLDPVASLIAARPNARITRLRYWK